MARSATTLMALALVTVGTAGCGDGAKGATAELRAAIARTRSLAHALVYTEKGPDGEVVVRADVADSFRYRALLTIDGRDVSEEVVVDDALAVRAMHPIAFELWERARATTAVEVRGPAADAPAADATAAPELPFALRAGQWALDDAGAPSLFVAPGDKRQPLGADPVLDALTALTYVEQAIAQSAGVHTFDAESLSYRAKEDPFPRPGENSGVTRYDFDRPQLPRPDNAGDGRSRTLPAAGHFRKMSVYVKDGLIVRVLEDIDVVGRLGDLRRGFNLDIADGASPRQQAEQAIAAINEARRAGGDDPIRMRTMSLDFVELGARTAGVRLPEGAVPASLVALPNRGSAPASAGNDEQAGPAAS